jgi:hypothetical protein
MTIVVMCKSTPQGVDSHVTQVHIQTQLCKYMISRLNKIKEKLEKIGNDYYNIVYKSLIGYNC